MRNIDIIVMGKTGAGKSTLINAVLNEELAPTNTVTRNNVSYSKNMMLPSQRDVDGTYGMVSCCLSMYDTVGLEIDHNITNDTLADIKKHMQEASDKLNSKDISLVWFCVDEMCKRFESYEIELIRNLSIEYEIPFVIVLTKCLSKKEEELEKHIKSVMPEAPLKKVLAQKYAIDEELFLPAYGVMELLSTSIVDYESCKVQILQKKIDQLDEKNKQRVEQIENEGKMCIDKNEKFASKIAIMPAGCIPFIHGICIKMITELNHIAGLSFGKEFSTDIFANFIVGIMVTPMMVVPLLSIPVAEAYIRAVGENYLEALLSIISESSDKELNDNRLMKLRLKEELSKIKRRGD